jgi:cysteine desulfurase
VAAECIYLDNNATTPMLPVVAEAMRPYLTEVYGNPASAHQMGRRARQALEDAREQTAALLDAHADEVIFTSGATEANNLAVFGLADERPGHIICSPIEHPCVIEPVRRLSELGFTFDWLPVDTSGVAELAALPGLLREDTRLVALMLANHETGAVQPITDCRSKIENQKSHPALHCDAVQAGGKMPVRFHELGVTTLSLSAHKFHGPKGVGALLIRRGTKLRPLHLGGHQERGRRPGTQPVALAVGLATALALAEKEREARLDHLRLLRSRFLDDLKAHAGPIVLNGPESGGLPHTINVSFPGCKADALLMSLDLAGVACSTGSACSSGSLLPSPVLQSMGVAGEVLHSAMRFSLSHLLSEADVEEASRRIAGVVRRLREESASRFALRE